MKLSLTRVLVASLLSVAAISPAMAQQEATGAGASFPAPLYAKWAEAYKAQTGIGMNYQSIGSGGGIKQIQSKTVDFGASDKPLTADELNKAGLTQFPAVMGGVVPVINLPEKFDICDIPDELVEVLHGEFGFPINEQVKNQTSVTFSITKFVEILLEIPGEHNFVLDVTDNDNVLTHKTVKLIVH